MFSGWPRYLAETGWGTTEESIEAREAIQRP